MKVTIDLEEEKDKEIIKALKSPTRQRILQLTKNNWLNVTQISEELDLSTANISEQVIILENAGLLKVKRVKGDTRGQQKLVKAKEV